MGFDWRIKALKIPSTYNLSRWLFVRSIGFVYLIAFGSLYTQVLGLIGSEGILPIEFFLKAVENNYGSERFFVVPTVFWFNHSDQILKGICLLGMCISLLLIIGILPAVSALACWFLYLSYLHTGQTFLSFQWDTLLLETGFLTIFFAPWCLYEFRIKTWKPNVAVLWLTRYLLFRLMFQSGMVKLLSQDPVWWDLTALTYHYWTQPIPNPLSWYAHHAPLWFHKFSCFMMFVIELGLPFFIFFGRRCRIIAFFGFTGLQIILMATGNYTFFNLLALFLGFSLVDDRFLIRKFPKKWLSKFLSNTQDKAEWKFNVWVRRILVCGLTYLIIVVTIGHFIGILGQRGKLPDFVRKTARSVSSYGSINRYGLFANMTTKRYEIVVEGSFDKKNWKEYTFHWKPGDLKRIPPQVAPHQPRLDWQMWFAALSSYHRNRWFVDFVRKLMMDSKPVIGLLEHNPFPNKPPRFIRAKFYDYTFSSIDEKKSTGQWWVRKNKGNYLPVVTIKP